jgi:hypothetical protein
MRNKENLVYVGENYLMNNEKFIMKWERNRQKGKLKYVITAGIISTTTGLVGFFIGILIKEGNFARSLTEYYSYIYMGVFLGSFIGSGIGSLAKWSRNEEKYNNLIKNRKNNDF